ncbi:MAG: hypothetical protein ABFE07_00800 [Armatimonadia bacterium]
MDSLPQTAARVPSAGPQHDPQNFRHRRKLGVATRAAARWRSIPEWGRVALIVSLLILCAYRGHADQTWHFLTWADGNDICASGWATTFDDVTTASGTSARQSGIIACSLPTGRCAATAGSPFPRLPYYTVVKVYNPRTGRVAYCALIDEGPAYAAEAGTGMAGSAMIDLTPSAARLLGMTDNTRVTIRIMRPIVLRPEIVTHQAPIYDRYLR